jgi:pyrroline-5-carboxylate reductase
MKYGFLGLGNMATAIIRGMRLSPAYAQAEIYGYDIDMVKTSSAAVTSCKSAEDCVNAADVIVLAVKPQSLEGLLTELTPFLNEKKLLVSIAAGKTIDFYQTLCPGLPFVRVMPNINANACAAVSAVCGGTYATARQVSLVKDLFSAVGTVYELPEGMFPAFSAIAGAAPAYAYMFIDALAGAGVKAGIPKVLALGIASDMVLGSAKMINESAPHPMELVDRVCSPAGTTIEGLHKLREKGFESAVYAAIEAVIEKDRKL